MKEESATFDYDLFKSSENVYFAIFCVNLYLFFIKKQCFSKKYQMKIVIELIHTRHKCPFYRCTIECTYLFFFCQQCLFLVLGTYLKCTYLIAAVAQCYKMAGVYFISPPPSQTSRLSLTFQSITLFYHAKNVMIQSS